MKESSVRNLLCACLGVASSCARAVGGGADAVEFRDITAGPDVVTTDAGQRDALDSESDGTDGDTDAADVLPDYSPCWLGDSSVDVVGPQREAFDRIDYIAHQAVRVYNAAIASGQPWNTTQFITSTRPRPSPAPVPAGTCVTDTPQTWSDPTWRALGFGFGPGESHRYSYEFDSSGMAAGAGFTARAFGDLDGDGVYSTFEMVGENQYDGGVLIRFGRIQQYWE